MTSLTKAGLRVVRLTPRGRGAVAVVVVEGPHATEAVAACFAAHHGRPLVQTPLDRVTLGRWGGPEGEELIVCRRTPQRIEVHPHGGEAAVESVVQRLVKLGAVELSWQAWVADAEGCPLRAAARIALAEAPTKRTAAVLLDQYHGALRRDLEQAIAALGNSISTSQLDVSTAREIVARLSQRSELGRHLIHPWRVVLAGAPNVGKSSLINALVGYERALVHEEPGTTRDVVAARTAVAGWPVELSDTAGLRDSNDPIEAGGVRIAERLVACADVVIYVLDASLPPNDIADVLARSGHTSLRSIIVANKVDLLDDRHRNEMARVADRRVQLLSAHTGEGVDVLLAAISAALVPDPPAAGGAVPFEEIHCKQIDAALHSLNIGDVPSAVRALQNLLVPQPS